MAGELVKIQDNVTSSATDQALSANSGRFLDTIKASLTGGVTITSGSDLNDPDYLKVGNYKSINQSVTTTLSNVPSGLTSAFMMKVYSPLEGPTSEGQNVSGSSNLHRIQEISHYYGYQRWSRRCSYNGSSETWTFGTWQSLLPEYNTYITTTAPTSSSADGIYLVI